MAVEGERALGTTPAAEQPWPDLPSAAASTDCTWAASFSLPPEYSKLSFLMEFKMFAFFTGKRFKKNDKYSERHNKP